MPCQRAVVAAKPIAPVIAHATLLASSRRGLDFPSVRTNAEIAAADRARLAIEARDVASKYSTRTIDPIVEAVSQAVHAAVRIERRKAGVQNLALVRYAITV